VAISCYEEGKGLDFLQDSRLILKGEFIIMRISKIHVIMVALALALTAFGATVFASSDIVTATNGQLEISPATGEFVWPTDDGVDELAPIQVINSQLPVDPVTGEYIWPIADGIDNGSTLDSSTSSQLQLQLK
jgi:hypothetical protein